MQNWVDQRWDWQVHDAGLLHCSSCSLPPARAVLLRFCPSRSSSPTVIIRPSHIPCPMMRPTKPWPHQGGVRQTAGGIMCGMGRNALGKLRTSLIDHVCNWPAMDVCTAYLEHHREWMSSKSQSSKLTGQQGGFQIKNTSNTREGALHCPRDVLAETPYSKGPIRLSPPRPSYERTPY